MTVTPYQIAERFIGLKEVAGSVSNPAIAAMLALYSGQLPDETPWCSAFVTYVCWLLNLPHSKSLAARSWLNIGEPIALADCKPGVDVVILNRGGPLTPNQPGPGHVGFFAGVQSSGVDMRVLVLGGNQSNSVSVASFRATDILGLRRLVPAEEGLPHVA